MVVYHVVINAYQIRNQSMQTCREYKFHEQIQKSVFKHIYTITNLYLHRVMCETKIENSRNLILTDFVKNSKLILPNRMYETCFPNKNNYHSIIGNLFSTMRPKS